MNCPNCGERYKWESKHVVGEGNYNNGSARKLPCICETPEFIKGRCRECHKDDVWIRGDEIHNHRITFAKKKCFDCILTKELLEKEAYIENHNLAQWRLNWHDNKLHREKYIKQNRNVENELKYLFSQIEITLPANNNQSNSPIPNQQPNLPQNNNQTLNTLQQFQAYLSANDIQSITQQSDGSLLIIFNSNNNSTSPNNPANSANSNPANPSQPNTTAPNQHIITNEQLTNISLCKIISAL